MFIAFFDDGGTNARQRIGVLAGYMAPQKEWASFDKEWAALIAEPKVPYFKAHDCDKGDGVYFGVSEAKRCELYDRATELICRHALVSVALGGRRPDFEGKWSEQVAREPPHFSRSAFQLSAHMGFATLGVLLHDRWRAERVQLICEAGTQRDQKIISDAYRHTVEDADFKKYTAHFAGCPAFHRKEDYKGLQAADFLAYELGKEYARRVDGKDSPPRSTWLRLLEHARKRGGVLRLVRRETPNTFGFGSEDSGI